MEKAIKKAMGIIIFLCLLAACTFSIMEIVKDKYNYYKYVEFYEEENSFDVLFFGSSRILDAVYPMELWEEYGITSYNMAQHSENTRISYWQMKNAFEHNTPKVAVVDVSLLNGMKITNDNVEMKSYLHKSLDHMPLSKTKYDALQDLTEGVDIWEYLFPFAMYHNRWNKLERMDIYTEWPCRKGAESRVALVPVERVLWCSEEVFANLDTESTGLNAMLSLCKEYNVQLVFSLMPTPLVSGSEGNCELVNAVEEFAKANEILFLNFAKEDDIIDYSLDFCDSSHLNPAGGKKLSRELGRILVDTFAFEEKQEETIAEWNNSWQLYLGAKLGELIAEEKKGNLANYLLLLLDNDYSVEIQLPEEGCIERYGIDSLLESLGISRRDIIGGTGDEIVVTVYRNDLGTVLHEARFAK